MWMNKPLRAMAATASGDLLQLDEQHAACDKFAITQPLIPLYGA
jgi:hypothetical protein